MYALRNWLALYTIPQCGFVTISKLLKIFSTPEALLSASSKDLRCAGVSEVLRRHLKKPNWKQVEACLHWQEKLGRTILHWDDPRYPFLLRQIASQPLILFIEGNVSLLGQRQLAIVGARQGSPTGLETSYTFASELAKQGFIITSGLARGIDAASHKGCLSQKEKTIAVLGSGLDRIYPACHQGLAEQILGAGGSLVSEFFPNASAKAEHFPRRNRIISGLSLGVIVVEATLRSGSLITARYAVEQGREVFALPGSIYSPLSEGCHALLKQGAILVESVQDILSELSFLTDFTIKSNRPFLPEPSVRDKSNSSDGLDSEDIKLVECLGFETTTIDTLVARTGLAADKLLSRLTWLELQGHISMVPGGYLRK